MEQIEPARSGHVVIGVDTHKHIHVAAVMDSIGGILAVPDDLDRHRRVPVNCRSGRRRSGRSLRSGSRAPVLMALD